MENLHLKNLKDNSLGFLILQKLSELKTNNEHTIHYSSKYIDNISEIY